MTDVFERAVQNLDRESRLLAGHPEPGSDSDSTRIDVAPWPDSGADLTDANSHYHPAALFPNTRARGVKSLVLRVMNVYTQRQIFFNAAVVRILNRWEPRLSALVGEVTESSHRLAAWLNRRIARLEERRSLWESRLTGRLALLEDRTSAAESDLAETRARGRDDRARLDALEDSVRRLERLLEREREATGAETLR
ncbi:MAG TPA: hypothetical protein VIY96_05965 [Thermoanaerobaculia bacterium]